MQRNRALLLTCFCALLAGESATYPPLKGQTTVAGAWRAETKAPAEEWTAVFRIDGRHLIGAVSSCSSKRPVEIIGQVDGETISFTCQSPDGNRTLTFTGRLNADTLELAWQKEVREGAFGWPDDPMFGDASPKVLKVTRASDPPKNVADVAAKARGSTAVGFNRILRAADEPRNWLTYSGNLSGDRHSGLRDITPANAKNLQLAWLHQTHTPRRIQATPLVVDGVMYTVVPGAVVALDAATGRVIWTFPYEPPPGARASGGGGRPNRGLAILGDRLFLGALDAHLIAIDSRTGRMIWKTRVADFADPACQGRLCYVITHAPLVMKDKVLVGVGGGEGPIRGFIASYDAATGKEVWRFYTVPAPGEPGNDTWAGESWKTGGVGVWQIGAYDPELNLTYWGTGNPFPGLDGTNRKGDNLYSNSVVALDVDTGRLKWHYQFTPHDEQDWDAAQVPVLADIVWKGTNRKVMLWANRNGLAYVLDRGTGQFLLGKPFVEVNWMTGFDEKGRPLRVTNQIVSEASPMRPGISATNWFPPSYSRSSGLFYIPAWERGSVKPAIPVHGPGGFAAVRAFDPATLEKKWEFVVRDAWFSSGILTTASDVLFVGTGGDAYSPPEAAARATDYFYALNARTGEQLWKTSLGGSVAGSPITYHVQGKQYVAVTGGNTLFAFAIRE